MASSFDTPLEEITTDERRHRLAVVQSRLQSIWTQIENRGLLRDPYLIDPVAKNLWKEFERLEVEERRYLVVGFPLTEVAAKAA